MAPRVHGIFAGLVASCALTFLVSERNSFAGAAMGLLGAVAWAVFGLKRLRHSGALPF
jgi:hypothetical protein